MVAHDLVFFVCERQSWSNCDTVACVDTHRVDVFNRADDDGVVGFVADNFHFKFFPAQKRLIDENLVHWRGVHACAAEVDIVFAVIRDAAACAAHGKGGADDGGEANFFKIGEGELHACVKIGAAVFFLGCGDDGRLRVFDAEAVHRFAEELAVFCHFNRGAAGTDHFNAEFLQHAHFFKCERGVEACLAAHCGQKRIGALFFDNLGDNLGRDRLDVGCVGKFRVCHDRGGIRVYQNDTVALFFQGFTGLCARVVKFARLPDYNRPRSDDHDRFDIVSLRHRGPHHLCSRIERRQVCANCRGL